MSLFNPWVILTLVCAFFGFGFQSYLLGEQHEQKKQQLEIAKLNAEARQKEQLLVSAVNTQATQLMKANQNAKLLQQKRDADIESGALKLRIAVKASDCPISTSANSASSSGDNVGTTSAELDPTTAKSLIAITDEGDVAIRKLATCVSLYNQARETLRSKP